jgi:phospholipid/cholesterol/gamma-HCH transport system substrate-binding protein
VIRTEASALQNIADTANRLVARLDQVLSERNIEHVSNTLQSIDSLTASLAAEREDLRAVIANAKASSAELNATLVDAHGVVRDVDRDFSSKLPTLVGKLDRTLDKLESAANGANGIVNENRAAIHSFTNDGLGQIGPTLTELRALVRDLRQVTDRLDSGPAGYILGRDRPKEFEPQ